ncbi:MAG: TIGR04076 family protein [Clostridiales bacterium]|nr:TIGR04076 family protein [Clostridiales bacterium]
MNVKITAVRKACYKDLINKYENPLDNPCEIDEGQIFVSVNGEMPQGFCPSAWESIRDFVKVLSEGGGNFFDGWMKNEKSALISCNDGFRPVSFLLETQN